jgi:hypothetical protein
MASDLKISSWVIVLTEHTFFDNFHLELPRSAELAGSIGQDDALIIVDTKNTQCFVAKSFTIEIKPNIYRIYLKSIQRNTLLPGGKLFSLLGSPSQIVKRLEWPIFEQIMTDAEILWDSLPTYSGSSKAEQSYIRELLELGCERDLLGPAGGPEEEIIGMSVRDRYLVGKLAPKFYGSILEPVEEGELIVPAHNSGEEFSQVGEDGDIGDDVNPESTRPSSQNLVPSSMGFTFCVDSEIDKIEVEACWGRYTRAESERTNEAGNPFRCWKRTPCSGKVSISIKTKTIPNTAVVENIEEVYLTGSVSKDKSGVQKLVTLFLVNNQILEPQEKNQDEKWLFQPEIIVRDAERNPIFHKRPIYLPLGLDSELASLELIYRNHVEFAVGHGVAVQATGIDENPELSREIRTKVLPTYEVPMTEAPGLDSNDRQAMKDLVQNQSLDMQKLSSMSKEQLRDTLMIMIHDYEAWIGDQLKNIDTLGSHKESAKFALINCDETRKRLIQGVTVLLTDERALKAFRFANQAMALQRIHSIYSLKRRRGEDVNLKDIDIPNNRSWRPFQIAFILLSIPSLADPTSEDRTNPERSIADLLWFPTGGGKTEAYLGVAAFVMAIRRLQGVMGGRDASRGLAVIMRYTLRLLTIQQFQRATTLICAMEVLRKSNSEWGQHPFRIGLWVGSKTTANTAKAAAASIESAREGGYTSNTTAEQLTHCPWCGTEIEFGRDVIYNKVVEQQLVFCGEKKGNCDFSKAKSQIGLPVVEVDEQMYRNPPTMMIATVDKFALIAWKGEVRNLFGKADKECPRHGLIWESAECSGTHRKQGEYPATRPSAIVPFRPPDLIIQDELHLISGPLGTMVGLYESAIDQLCSWELNERKIKPKIIASTATVRKAAEQVNNLFMRKVSIFPPSGIDVEDNFFAIQRPTSEKPGRKYLGICSPGSSRPSVLIRVYTALLTASQALFDTFGQAADPYLTLVGYFNSLRELGGMRRLTEDDVRTRAYRVQMSNVYRPGLAQRSIHGDTRELTSRVSSKMIPQTLDQLEVKFKKDKSKNEEKAIDIVLATNMLSVGVDVIRLGLMVVNGQPKNVSEYIQATSRVGRTFPGFVCTVLTWTRPRDLSHYETFGHFHSTFYKHVEAQSVTPFSARALDRGLTGAMIGIMRNEFESLNPNLGASRINDLESLKSDSVRDELADRAWKSKDKESKNLVENMIDERLDKWKKGASRGGRRLGFNFEKSQGDVVALLEKPSDKSWSKWTVPFSMREVEPGVRLVMKTERLEESPAWTVYQEPSNGLNNDE